MLGGAFLLKLTNYRPVATRAFCLNRSNFAAEASPLYRLRQRTGLAYSLCREALNKHSNDVQEAEAWLKAQSIAHGLQRAFKVSERSAREGLIGLGIQRDHRRITVLEINCETDFVAKNEIFRNFAHNITKQATYMNDGCSVHHQPGQEHVQEIRLSDEHLRCLSEQSAELINRLGENIKLSKALHFQTTSDQVKLFGRIHANVGHASYGGVDISIGRFGALVALRDLVASGQREEVMAASASRLCQHVIGYNPTYIELPDNLRHHLEEAQNQVAENKEEDGDAQSDLEDETAPRNPRDDWPSMMDQTLIDAEGLIVRDYCSENKLSVVYFSRFECGQFE